MFKGSRIAVVIPAYNEESLIQDTMNGIPNYVDRIYVVNDGSKDATEEQVKEVASNDDRFILINHEVNKGVGAAIVTGYLRSCMDKMDITAVMAGDNQMDPLELPKLLDPIINGEADFAKGNRLKTRFTAKGMSDWRYFGNNVLTLLTRLAAGNKQINDPQNGYTAISNHVFKIMSPESIFTWYGYCNDMLVKLCTYDFVIKDVVIPARYGNERSKISYPKYVIRISRLLFNELIWRLNYQHLRESSRKANSVMALGGTMSSIGLLVTSVSILTPFFHTGTPESPAGLLIILVLTGAVITYLGYALKKGGKLRIHEKCNKEDMPLKIK